MTAPFPRKSPIVEAMASLGQSSDRASSGSVAGAHQPARRARLWELPQKFHCPLMGTCLCAEELRRFARRHAFNADSRDEYALHVEAVLRAGTRNAFAEDLNRHFDDTFDADVTRFERIKTAEELLSFWKAHFERGEVAGPMWAALTHRAANEETRHAVYADVHMLSHQLGAGRAADARRLAWLARHNQELAAKIERFRADAAEREKEIKQLGIELKTARAAEAVAKSDVAALSERLGAYESGQAFADLGRRLMTLASANEELRAEVARSRALQGKLHDLEEQVAALARENDVLVAERDALERILLAGEANEAACDIRCAACASRATGQCILLVGGRQSLVARYRALAHRLGIRLVHHDGGREQSLSRLPDLINGAEAVLCPTDCVSHAAYFKLKQHCKRAGKPCLLFKGASVSAFAVALAQLSAGKASIAGNKTVQ